MALQSRPRDSKPTSAERAELIRRLRLHGHTAAEANALVPGGKARAECADTARGAAKAAKRQGQESEGRQR
jgi:hypothetical protein